ncbi:MAG TPA: gamma-glutamyl-phosphate reductase, partial [Burkholderiaceae bacterium]|nr:gamma-glutamyl-phosphate reductase [Burkholderiaceae bacterium]
MDKLKTTLTEQGQRARAAAAAMARASTAAKNQALRALAQHLARAQSALLEANARDVQRAQAAGADAAFIDRLSLDPERIAKLIAGLDQVAALPDPIGQIDHVRPQPSGIRVGQMRVPLGVIAIIYESRPGVTIDAAALTLKSGNATLLRGGSEAIESNRLLAGCLGQALNDAGL